MMPPSSPAPGPPPGKAASQPAPEASERGVAQTYRRRSWQSQIKGFLPLAMVLVVGLALLGGYYSHVAGRQVSAARHRGNDSGTGEDVPLPALGHIAPPVAAAPLPANSAVDLTAPAPAEGSTPLPAAVLMPAPSQPGGQGPAAAVTRSPAQLALERKLSGPAFEREERNLAGGAGASGTAAAADVAVAVAAGAGPSAPMTAAMAPEGAAEAHAAAVGPGFANLLVPTVTPTVSARALPTQGLLLAKGTFIDCTLETAIDSSLPGMTTCITATDTFSVDGKVVLLERGSKLVGETRGQVQQGGSRLFVLWTEARTPSGVVVPLASPGTDELGRAGVSGEVERHFWQRFGAAILISVIDGGLQAAARPGSGSVVYDTSSSRDVATEALRSNVGIAPTLLKPQGDRIQVLVARDLDFRSVYDLKVPSGVRP